MGELPRPEVILDIVEEHFEELDFLWEQRESVVFAPDWILQELAEHEERCEAHLDGLRLAGANAVEIARPALRGEEPGAATAATMVFLAFGSPELDAEVMEALASAEEPAREGIRIGMRHSDVSRVASHLTQLASQGDPLARIAATDALAFHRLSPPGNLRGLLSDAEAGARLYPAIGRFGGPWEAEDLRRALESDDMAAQRAALEASARVGLRELAGICRQAATRVGDPSAAALEILGVVGRVEDLKPLRRALEDPTVAEAALAGIAALGSVAAIPDLIEAMKDETLTVTAGAAFRRITGAEDIDAEEALPAPEGLPDDELDFHQPVVPADPEKARAWWESQKSRFDENAFWQAGRELDGEWPGDVFNMLPLETRRDVWLGHRSRGSAGAADLELEARAVSQLSVQPV